MLAWHKPWAGYSAWQLTPGIPAPQEAKVGSPEVQGHPWLPRLHDQPELHRSYLPISNDNDNNRKKNLTFLTAIFTGCFSYLKPTGPSLNLSSYLCISFLGDVFNSTSFIWKHELQI